MTQIGLNQIIRIAVLAPMLAASAFGQTSGKAEFEIASIKTNAARPGFHVASDEVFGGPGSPDPGMFRCSQCSLTTLIVKAFNLQPYQFPGRSSVSDDTYDIQARVPPGTGGEEFPVMLQNLLKDRFGLAWHFQDKQMKGYRLVIAKTGSKLKESSAAPSPAAAADEQRGGRGDFNGEPHSHSGAMVFGTSGVYRAPNQTTADVARVLSDQTGLPVDDQTGLPGRYNILLRWSGAAAARPTEHSGDHAGYGRGGAYGQTADASGPTLFDALQEQLGLRLVPAEQALAHLFVIDHVSRRPTEN